MLMQACVFVWAYVCLFCTSSSFGEFLSDGYDVLYGYLYSASTGGYSEALSAWQAGEKKGLQTT